MLSLMSHTARRKAVTALLALVALGASACITRPVKEKVWTDGYTEVFLRSEKQGTRTLSKGFQHPATIAPIRMAHILSRIDLRKTVDDQSVRMPVVPLETLFIIGEAMSEGLKQADPDQEVVVQSIRRGKSLKIFERQFLTSMLAYMRDDLLYIHISRSDWEIPARKKDKLPETHIGKHPLKFHLVVDRGMRLADQQSVAVEWTDPIFKKPTRTRITPTGRVVRRQVLMESFEDDTVFEQGPKVESLSAEQLRGLADLDDARRSGAISEGEYHSRKNAILRGELPEP